MELTQLFPGQSKTPRQKANLITFHFSILLAFFLSKKLVIAEQKRIRKSKVRTSPVFHQDLALALGTSHRKFQPKKTHQIHSSEISEIHSIRISFHDLEHDFMKFAVKVTVHCQTSQLQPCLPPLDSDLRGSASVSNHWANAGNRDNTRAIYRRTPRNFHVFRGTNLKKWTVLVVRSAGSNAVKGVRHRNWNMLII